MNAVPYRMTADVLIFRSQSDEDERVIAYYALLAVKPEMAHASSIVREQEINRLIGGLRQAVRGFAPRDPLDQRAHGQALALMEADREARAERLARGGW